MTTAMSIQVTEDGRMVLPRPVREALGLTGAGVVVLSIDGDDVKLSSICKSIQQAQAQALYRAHVSDDQPSEVFLEARRLEASNEHGVS